MQLSSSNFGVLNTRGCVLPEAAVWTGCDKAGASPLCHPDQTCTHPYCNLGYELSA